MCVIPLFSGGNEKQESQAENEDDQKMPYVIQIKTAVVIEDSLLNNPQDQAEVRSAALAQFKELIERNQSNPDWNEVELEIVPVSC
jgi:hypothetical protein